MDITKCLYRCYTILSKRRDAMLRYFWQEKRNKSTETKTLYTKKKCQDDVSVRNEIIEAKVERISSATILFCMPLYLCT